MQPISPPTTSTTSSRRPSSAIPPSPHHNHHPLFDFIACLTNTPQPPRIIYRYPEQILQTEKGIMESLPMFCWPDDTSNATPGETFSFLLADEEGVKRFGYCWREKIGTKVYCIMSRIPSFHIFSQIIDIVETLSQEEPNGEASKLFLKAAAQAQLPSDSETVTIDSRWSITMYRRKGVEHEVAGRWGRLTGEHINASLLLQKLGVHTLLQLFCMILLERRIILVASALSTLSTIAHSLIALLYPFTYTNVFIPILPTSLIEVTASPTPYIIGLTRKNYATLPGGTEELSVVDLDNGRIHRWDTRKPDEQYLQDVLKIGNLNAELSDALTWNLEEEMAGREAGDEKVLEAFLGFWTELLAGYRRGFKKVLVSKGSGELFHPITSRPTTPSRNAPTAHTIHTPHARHSNTPNHMQPGRRASASHRRPHSTSPMSTPNRDSPVQFNNGPSPLRKAVTINEASLEETFVFDTVQFLSARPKTQNDGCVRHLLHTLMQGQMWDWWVHSREVWINKEVWSGSSRSGSRGPTSRPSSALSNTIGGRSEKEFERLLVKNNPIGERGRLGYEIYMGSEPPEQTRSEPTSVMASRTTSPSKLSTMEEVVSPSESKKGFREMVFGKWGKSNKNEKLSSKPAPSDGQGKSPRVLHGEAGYFVPT